ncbi:MAG: magnesium transporter [Halobacteriovoraceae bacterium]|nr:magnesium transporter [Halobacteriovoraceae bacterium]
MSIFSKFTDSVIHFSNLIGIPIFNEDGKRYGQLKDLFVDYGEVYPMVLGLLYIQNQQFFYVTWDQVVEFSPKKIIIKKNSEIRRSRTFTKTIDKMNFKNILGGQSAGETIEYPPVGKVVLDKQIVDTSGKKVIRVNDIQLIKIGQFLRITHAEVGLRSMVRRLELEKFVDFIVKIFAPKSNYLVSDTLISWKFVHTIPDKSFSKNVEINLRDEDIRQLHPADIADILEDLDSKGRQLIFKSLNPELAAATLTEVEQDMQAGLLKNTNSEKAAKIIENMGTDEAADILGELEEKRVKEIISNIEDTEIQVEIAELIEYEENSAGGLMTTEFFEISPEKTRSQIIEEIQEKHDDLETVYDLYIVDKDYKLLGTCTLKELLIQKQDVTISDIMNTGDIKSLPPHSNWKEVASVMSKYNLINIPIVNETDELLGIVSVDDVLPWLLNER